MRITTVAAVSTGCLAVLTSGAVAGHFIAPKSELHRVVITPPPLTATAIERVTTTATETASVLVPTPVYVTLTPRQQMTQLEATAYCNNLAAEAWPYEPNADPLLDQMGRAYTDTQRERTVKQCLTEHGH